MGDMTSARGPQHKSRSRRNEIRRRLPEPRRRVIEVLSRDATWVSLGILAVFVLGTLAIMTLRPQVVPLRPGQYAAHDIASRLDFTYHDEDLLDRRREAARHAEPAVFSPGEPAFQSVEAILLNLPGRVAGKELSQLPEPLQSVLDNATMSRIAAYAGQNQDQWVQMVRAYLQDLREMNVVVLPEDQRARTLGDSIMVKGVGLIPADQTRSPAMTDDLRRLTQPAAQAIFPSTIWPKVLSLTLAVVEPTHVYDEPATTRARNRAAEVVPFSEGLVQYSRLQTIVNEGEVDERDFRLLRAEQAAFLRKVGGTWRHWLGLTAGVLLLAGALAVYAARFKPRIVQNHARAAGLVGLLLSMLLVSMLAAVGSGPLYLFAAGPVALVAMILAIAYDQRFALGVATIHAALTTLALNQNIGLLLVMAAGLVTACLLLDDVRTRSKLIEVGGASAGAMMAATFAVGLLGADPLSFVLQDAMYAGVGGLAAGFVVLGVLPFIERAFRITTSMTLLELADASHPLLRRLSLEAPGTYNHSLQVANLAEECAEAIGANAMLCRVGSYYHDIGKLNKPEYFIENQSGGENRHLNLSPSVSLLIIIAHVKDGVELAKESNLPTSLVTFIQEHHGSTVVEYFYHRACQHQQNQQGAAEVERDQYRYPGPRPRTRESAIVMCADAVESATRSLREHSPARVEGLVHEIIQKRLADGQFDDCDLTLADLHRVERVLTRTLLSIYHGRIAYPGNAGLPHDRAKPEESGLPEAQQA